MAGVDQFGGNNDAGPVIEAYKMGVKEHGEEFMRERFEQSAVRLLRNIFRTVCLKILIWILKNQRIQWAKQNL